MKQLIPESGAKMQQLGLFLEQSIFSLLLFSKIGGLLTFPFLSKRRYMSAMIM
jgi:hypothetical protein